MLGPLLEKLHHEAKGVWKLVKINTDDHQNLALQFNISSIPAVKLFVDGNVVAEFLGALPEPQLRGWLNQHIPTPTKKNLLKIQQAKLESRFADGLDLVNAAYQTDPHDIETRVLRAELHFLLGKTCNDRLDDIPDLHAQAAAAQAVRDLEELLRRSAAIEKQADLQKTSWKNYLQGLRHLQTRNIESALTSLIEAIKAKRDLDNGFAHKAVVALFRVLGETHPLSQTYRRDLAMALY